MPDGGAGRATPFDRVALQRAFERFGGSHVTLHARAYLPDDLVRRIKATLSEAAGREIVVEMRMNPTMDAGAVVEVGDECRLVLDPRSTWVGDLGRTVAQAVETGEMRTHEDAYAYIRSLLEDTEPARGMEELSDIGSVLEVGDGVALVSGLRDVGSQELVEFETGVFGMAFSLISDKVGCILLGPEEGVREGGDVRRTGHLLRVPVGDAMLGRIVNALGQPLDGKGPIVPDSFMPAERKAPGVVERAPVDTPLHTGIKVIDALVPLGRGQRELVIGDRQVGKTTVVLDAILSQRDTGVSCVYCAIGQKASSVARAVRVLEEHDALRYTAVVVALPSEPPAFRHVAPYAACAVGEFFMDRGDDALVVYDDLSKHAVTYREMASLLKRPVGREAYPGDVFYVHSRLLERAARLNESLGGGSLTGLPVVETLAGDISAFIPTNVISIADGQIVLDTQLFNEGIRPAMDVGLSVSRVGGSAQTPAMKRIAGRLRIDLAQYQEMAQFVKFGAEVDASTLSQLARGERAREMLKQRQHDPRLLEHELAALFAVVNGMLDDVEVSDVLGLEASLSEYLRVHEPELLRRLQGGEAMPEALEAELRAAVLEFLRRRAEEPEPIPVQPSTAEETPGEPVAAADEVAAGAVS